jgi:hypothetical protein
MIRVVLGVGVIDDVDVAEAVDDSEDVVDIDMIGDTV